MIILGLFPKYFDDEDGDKDFVNGVGDEDNDDDDDDNMAVLGKSEEQQTTLLVGSWARLKAI